MTHSRVIIKFCESLTTNFFKKLKQKPNWSKSEIETEYLEAVIETLTETIIVLMENFNNLYKGRKVR